MSYPMPMRNAAIEAEAETLGVPAYKDGEYPVALNEAQQRQMEARGWEPALVRVDDLSKLTHGELVSAAESAGIDAPPRATKKDLAALLTKRNAEVVVDTTQEPPAVVANPVENKE